MVKNYLTLLGWLLSNIKEGKGREKEREGEDKIKKGKEGEREGRGIEG
jgi:hypothetical protein